MALWDELSGVRQAFRARSQDFAALKSRLEVLEVSAESSDRYIPGAKTDKGSAKHDLSRFGRNFLLG